MTTFQPLAAGQRLTAEELNLNLMIGCTVFRAYRTTAQSITSGAETAANALSWNQIDLDRLSAGALNTTRWTCPTAGWWTVSGSISFNGSTAGSQRDAAWFVNGSLITAGRSRTFAETSIANTPLTVEARSLPVQLAVGDYVELIPVQNTGGAIDTATGSNTPYMAVTYSGPN